MAEPLEVEACIGLGANLGDREASIRRALEEMEMLGRVTAVSSFYETDPVGRVDQPPFLNAAAKLSTALPPRELLDGLKAIEAKLGRRGRERWGPREIDLDLLLYGDSVIGEGELVVPHPRMHERAFVLVPLAEIAPEARHPVLGKTIGELAKGIDRAGVSRLER